MSGWADVGKSSGSGLGGRFVSIEKDTTVRLRILDEEPHNTRVHKITQNVTKGGKTEEVFRSIPATDLPDESFILKHNAKRYPEQQIHSMRCNEYKRGDDGKFTVDGSEIKILQGGPAIFKSLFALYKEHGSLTQFDVTIARKGEGRDTEYTVSAAPFPLKPDLDVSAVMAKMNADTAVQWDNVFQKVTAADQMKALSEAGFDINYDPASVIAQAMTLEEARNTKFTFGKHKGKSVGELSITDPGYLDWGAENITSNDVVQAACRIATANVGAAASIQAPVQQSIPASAPVAAAPPSGDKAALVEQVNDNFEQNPRFSDLSVMVELVKKHSGGKTRVKDLTIPQLTSLLSEITAA